MDAQTKENWAFSSGLVAGAGMILMIEMFVQGWLG